MKVKVIQADTRPLKLYLETRDLNYGPSNHMNIPYLLSLNDNMLLQNKDPNSIATVVNILKCKMIGYQYEFIKGNPLEWEEHGTKAHCWIKIDSLMKQMSDSKYSDIELFCFIDSDAWIRDEQALISFCEDFKKSSHLIGLPRDIEVSENGTFFNSGFICIKNTKEAYDILDTIYNHPDYRAYDRVNLHEQRCLSMYYEKHPEKFMVLPLNDFNTPCGRIVRHCWLKHLVEHFVVEEAIAVLTKLSLSFTREPGFSVGNDVQIFPPK